MARVQSFTTSGQPITAPPMTLDALMQRQRDLQSNVPSANREMVSPWQGAAYLGDVIANKVNQGRADADLADARQQLAQLKAGIDYENITPQDVANVGMFSDEEAAKMQDALLKLADYRRSRVDKRADLTEQRSYEERIAKENWDREQADQREDEQRAIDAQIAEENRAAGRGSTNLGKLKADLAAGLITREQYDAAVADELRPPANTGMELEFDEDGRVTGFRQGTGVGSGKSAATQGGKNLANAQESYRAAAQSANDLLGTIDNMEKAGGSAGYTGPGGGIYGTIDDLLEAGSEFLLGDDYSLPGSSPGRAVVKGGGLSFILDAVQKTKGSISNAENQLFASTAPGLQTTPRGRKILLGVAKGVAQRSIERDQRAQEWVSENGNLDGFEQSWNQYIEANPLILPDDQGGIRLATEAPPAPADGSGAAPAPAEAPAASTGAYEAGKTYTFDEGTFQFLGGDPADTNSWKHIGG